MTIPAVGSPDWSSTEHLPRTVTNVGFAGANHQLVTGIGLIIAISAINNTLTTAGLGWLRDGTDVTGEYLVMVSVPAAGSFALGPCAPGIPFRRGLFMQIYSGGIDIAVTYIPVVAPF